MGATTSVRVTGLVTAVLVLGGCGTTGPAAGPEPTKETTTVSSTLPTSEPADPSEPGQSDTPDTSGADPEVAQAVADLAAQQGMPEDEVAVASVEEVTWRDGSLGCAEPGSMYTQALVPGRRIVLEVAGERFEYHAGGERPPFLCAEPTQ
ncbi:MAG: hypothetical protein CMH83_04560 [Nocardioides sp.]|nr:hypothetical protein [Nocardioides sp.]